MPLSNAELEREYCINAIDSDDDELIRFLFSLGCYEGEHVTVINKKKNNLILSVKDARYNIDMDLARAILV